MAGVLDSVNQRTQLVGQNRLELLLFRLDGAQLYGINVFKVREVLPCPRLTVLPGSARVVRGVASIRGSTLPIIDLSLATGGPALGDLQGSFAIIAEYSGRTLGFLVRSVERIVNLNWAEIVAPPRGAGRNHYLTAVTRLGEQLVEIIDVERVLAEAAPPAEREMPVPHAEVAAGAAAWKVLVVDDSAVARRQIVRCMEAVGVQVLTASDGRQALDCLRRMAGGDGRPDEALLMMISDIEMPEMDGYTLTMEVRQDPQLRGLHVLLHTSLSGVFNQNMVRRAGADDFLAKFRPDELATRVVERVRQLAAS